jgi:hypothetical protein
MLLMVTKLLEVIIRYQRGFLFLEYVLSKGMNVWEMGLYQHTLPDLRSSPPRKEGRKKGPKGMGLCIEPSPP